MMISTLERERLAALDRFEILDSASEPLFDCLTELAAKTFGTPIALISLVDAERQWFKSCVGLDVDHTSREISFCQYAIRDDRVFVVLDALEDPRFAVNPLVQGSPFIRFYAGAPLIAPDGHRLGTLCIIDTAPRPEFSPSEAEKLAALAATVMQALVLRLSARERDRIDAVARERTALLRQAEELAGVGTWSLDAATGHTTWSPEVFHIHALEASAGGPDFKGAVTQYHPDDVQAVADHVQRALTLGTAFTVHARIIRPDGEARHVAVRGESRDGPDGRINGLFGTIQDVTALRLADMALRESEARMRHLLDNAPDMIVRYGAQGEPLEYSPACRQYGYEPYEMLLKSPADLVHPDDLGGMLALRTAILSGQDLTRSFSREFRIRTKDGAWRWVQGNPAVLYADDGALREVVSVVRDVTLQKNAELALVESEARYRLMTQNAQDIIACHDPDGRLTYVSPAVAAILGYAPEDLVGETPARIMHPDDIQPTVRLLTDFAARGPDAPPIRYEYRAYRKDGSLIWLEANPRAIFDPETGAFLEFQDVVRDATQRKRLETELASACAEAIAATAVKSEFMANMSHEIRTPLTAIIGFTNLLMERSDLPESARMQVKRVKGAGGALLTIVNDILDFSEIEAHKIRIAPKPVAISELAQDAMAMFAPQADDKSLWLEFEQDPAVPANVSVDPDRLRQILMNLIGNAVKFTDAGSIQLRMTYDTNARQLGFEIEDTGPGMDEAEQAKLFQRFSQVDAATTRRHSGTGLGLVISKALAEAMGGGIGVRSKPGEGSTFFFSVHAPEASAASLLAGDVADLDGVRVLLADDSASNRDVARLLLEKTGAEVTEALDGEEAVQLAGEAPFDVILLDLQMPPMDAAAAMAVIRAMDGPNQDIPILAFGAAGDLAALSSKGFDGVIAKPVLAADLISQIAAATSWSDSEVMLEDAHVVRA